MSHSATIKYLQPHQDHEFGMGGFVQTNVFPEWDLSQLIPTKSARVFTHDLIEHCDQTSGLESSINELIALGAVMHNRRHDFYNGMGNDGFVYEVAEQIIHLMSSGFNPRTHKRFTSSSYQVASELDYETWQEIKSAVKSESSGDCEIESHESRLWRSIVYRCLSRGYNRMMWYANRYGCDFSYRWGSLVSELESVLDDLKYLMCDSFYLEEVKVSLNLGRRELTLDPVWDTNSLENEAYNIYSGDEDEDNAIEGYVYDYTSQFEKTVISF